MSKAAAPRRVGDKEALAVGNTIPGSARKLNLVATMIRGRKVEEGRRPQGPRFGGGQCREQP